MAKCPKLYVSLLAGQSNGVGLADPAGLSPINERFEYSYAPTIYSYQRPDWQTGDIQESKSCEPVSLSDNGFGVEMVLSRLLWLDRTNLLGPDDRIVLLKYASGGVPLNAWRPSTDTTGFWPAFSQWMQDSIADLEDKSCEIEFEKLFWIQGESDSNAAAAPNYVTRFQDFKTSLDAITGHPLDVVFSELKANRGTVSDPFAAQINAAMAAVYPTTGSNDDLLVFDGIHYDADSLVEIARRLHTA